jgi:hypothetical protein
VENAPPGKFLTPLRLTLVVAVMLASTPVMFMSGVPQFGWDFLNLYEFHHCEYRDTPYLEAAIGCDARAWPMDYPPLLYWSFTWVRWLSFEMAYSIWVICIAVGILGTAWLWSVRMEGSPVLPKSYRSLFAIGLLLLFPSGFAITTGNNDMLVLVLWSASWLAFVNGGLFVAGLIAGAAIAYKLYPAFAAALVIATLAVRDRQASVRFTLGVGSTLLVQGLLFSSQIAAYLPGNFRNFVLDLREPNWFEHSVPAIDRAFLGGPYGLLISGAVFLSWLAAFARPWKTDISLIFAGALAISTFFAATSYDYNLITTFPLLVYLFVVSTTSAGLRSNVLFLCLLGGLFVLGNRNLTMWLDRGRQWHGVLQVVWLLGLAAALYWTSPGRRRLESRETVATP